MALTYSTTGTASWGTVNITMSSGIANGNIFVCDDFKTTSGTWQATRNDNVGNPNGWLGGVERISGTATLQVASTSTIIPYQFDRFSFTLRPGQNANIFALTEIGLPKKQRDFDTCEVTFMEVA